MQVIPERPIKVVIPVRPIEPRPDRPIKVVDPKPDRPIKVVVPYPPGGGTDVVARIVTQKMATVLDATIVVDNRAGAGGTRPGA